MNPSASTIESLSESPTNASSTKNTFFGFWNFMSSPFFLNILRSVIAISCVAVIVMAVLNNDITTNFSEKIYSLTNPQDCKCGGMNEEGIKNNEQSATTGRLFKGEQVNRYDRIYIEFSNYEEDSQKKYQENSDTFGFPEMYCKKWNVLTTIFGPTTAMLKQIQLDGWCTVVVGDKKGLSNYEFPEDAKCIYLDVNKQIELTKNYTFIEKIPWNHFGRKNIGYLYAIAHGAEVVWDFDDDNMLIGNDRELEVPGMGKLIYSYHSSISDTKQIFKAVFPILKSETTAFNPYPFMGATAPMTWPRGYPLELIKENTSYISFSDIQLDIRQVGIIQSAADHDPDVDAIYRMTQPLPFNFDPTIAITKDKPVVIPSRVYTPYNAQATLHFYPALWSLLLPVTVHGRVSDIWRGYIFQRLAQDLDVRLVYSPSMVLQDRNAHRYLADFDSEDQLYKRSQRLIEQLIDWNPNSKSLVGRIEELYIFLYEHGYLSKLDVVLVQLWLKSLIMIGYQFPPLIQSVNENL